MAYQSPCVIGIKTWKTGMACAEGKAKSPWSGWRSREGGCDRDVGSPSIIPGLRIPGQPNGELGPVLRPCA